MSSRLVLRSIAVMSIVILVTMFIYKPSARQDTFVLSKPSALSGVLTQGPDFPKLLYNWTLSLKAQHGLKVVYLNKLLQQCHGDKQHSDACETVQRLAAVFGPGSFNIQQHLYNLGILRTRQLASVPRPYTCNGCFNYTFHRLLSPRKNICSGRHVELLILITTTPLAVDARSALRDTWLRHSANNTADIRYVFLFGSGWGKTETKIIQREANTHGDVLQEDYMDSYYNLSYKVLSGWRWAAEQCPSANFVSRSADDMFLNIPRIRNFLQKNRPKLSNVQLGYCLPSAFVKRTWHRHYQSQRDYPQRLYGPFCIGTTVINSMASNIAMIKAAPNVPWFNLEDHWVGMVMEKAKVGIKNVPGFDIYYSKDPNEQMRSQRKEKKNPCQFPQNWYTLHRVTPNDIQAIQRICVTQRGLDGESPPH